MSNAALRRRISLGPRRMFTRRDMSSPSEMLLAAAIIFSIGRNAPHAISHPPPMDSTRMAGSSVQVSTSMVCIRPELSSVVIMPRTHMAVMSMSISVS